MILIISIIMIMIITKTILKHSDLVFSEGVNQDAIDIVDDEAKSQNNRVSGNSCAEGVSITRTTRHAIAIR